ncbi:MAG: hypothetical protein R3250_13850 [Melioribacteraceae bacterium]|nr:hypothetical protein [Melioribacteraceae bacterium]
MNRKLTSTLLLLGILVLIIISGGTYTYYYQDNDIAENQEKLDELNLTAYDTEELKMQLADLKGKVAELDSILALRKYIIPVNLPQSDFFKFINNVSSQFSELSHVNVEFQGEGEPMDFYSYLFAIKGTAEFNDLFKLLYSIEQSKELKKIIDGELTNFVEVDNEGIPHYLVSYSFKVMVYFSDTDTYASAQYKENSLKSNSLYNIFFPLIRDEIPANVNDLLDVQTAQLLALIPDGAYVADASGNTHLLWEGDEVYLGYLTKIDYNTNEVKFVLNKGGVIEKITLKLEKNLSENDKKSKSK